MRRFAIAAPLLVLMLFAALGSGPSDTAKSAALIGVSAPTVTTKPIVEFTKRCPNIRYVGRDATFELVVANRGDGPAYDVVVNDVMPPGLDLIQADNKGAREGGNLVWRLGTLAAGESRVLNATFRCNRIGRFKNAATVTYCAEARDECELEVKGIPAILIECVDSPDPIELNSELTYTITVTNQGSAVGTNIDIECTLPAEEEYVRSVGPTTATSSGKMVTFAPLPTLAPKAKAVYKLTVKGIGEGDVRFKVQMESDQMTSPVMETESTHIYN